MLRKSLIAGLVLMGVMFLAAERSFAQGPCLLGVGNNCPPPQTTTQPADNGNRFVDIRDGRAAEIWRAKQNNQRYLLVLSRYFENGRLCEDRAWVAGDYAGGPDRISVRVGKSKKVCFDPAKPVWTAQQVNQAEAAIDSWTDAVYKWEKYAETNANYMNQYRNNQQAVAYAQNEIAKSRAWVNYYHKYIDYYRSAVNQVAP